MCQTNKARCNVVSMWDETHIRMNERKKTHAGKLSLSFQKQKRQLSALCGLLLNPDRDTSMQYIRKRIQFTS